MSRFGRTRLTQRIQGLLQGSEGDLATRPRARAGKRISTPGTLQGFDILDRREIETVLKGPEVSLQGRVHLDKGGDERRYARRRWWDPDATTLRSAALIPGDIKGLDGQPFPPLPARAARWSPTGLTARPF